MSAERWYSKRELARTLRVSVSTIERNYSPTMVVGHQNRYTMSDIERQSSELTQRRCKGAEVIELRRAA